MSLLSDTRNYTCWNEKSPFSTDRSDDETERRLQAQSDEWREQAARAMISPLVATAELRIPTPPALPSQRTGIGTDMAEFVGETKTRVVDFVKRLLLTPARANAILLEWFCNRHHSTTLMERLAWFMESVFAAKMEMEVDNEGNMRVLNLKMFSIPFASLSRDERDILASFIARWSRVFASKSVIPTGTATPLVVYANCLFNGAIAAEVRAEALVARVFAMLLYSAHVGDADGGVQMQMMLDTALVRFWLSADDALKARLRGIRDIIDYGANAIIDGRWDPAMDYLPHTKYKYLAQFN